MPYSKTREIIKRGLRSAQPLASSVQEGSLYRVTDEGITERSNGTIWESFSDLIVRPAFPLPIEFEESEEGIALPTSNILLPSNVALLDAANIFSSTGTTVFQGDVRLQNSGGVARNLRLYNSTGTNEALLRDIGGGGVSIFVVEPAGTEALRIETTGITIAELLTLTKGQIKFPATQNASSNVNTLDDYEEGTWTPTDGSGAGLTFTVYGSPHYVKIGKMVAFSCNVQWPVTANGADAAISGFPFVSAASQYAVPPGLNTTGVDGGCFVEGGVSYANLYKVFTGAKFTNAEMSGNYWFFSGTYLAAN
jgi:hypothetical protein